MPALLLLALLAADAPKPLEARDVKRQIRKDARACYLAYVKAHPRPPEKLTVAATVNGAGGVEGVKVAGADKAADACLEGRAAKWTFANPRGGKLAVSLELPLAEIDPDAAPIAPAEVRALLPFLEKAQVLEPLDDDGNEQVRARLCLPGDVARDAGIEEAASTLARQLEAAGWKATVKSGGPKMRYVNGAQKGYQLGGRVAPWAGAKGACAGYDAALSVKAPSMGVK